VTDLPDIDESAGAPPEPNRRVALPAPWQLLHYWRRELGRALGLVLLGSLLGWLFGYPYHGAGIAVLLLLLRQMRHLIELRTWLQRPKYYDLPDPGGLWGEVFDLQLDIQRKHRRKKKKLAAMLAEFQASTAALPDGAVVLGQHGDISWFNSAARGLLGLRTPQDVGIRIANLIRHPEFTDYYMRGDFQQEIEAPSPLNRAKTLSLRIIPYGNQQMLLIVRDVSERHQLEAARRDFVANASHELRTPLTVMRGYLDVMDMDAQGSDAPLAPWRSPLTEMRNQALRMEALVNDMLKLARLEADRSQMPDEALAVGALLTRAVDEAKAVSGGQHRFELHLEPGLSLSGGEIELHSIFSNLLTNAVRYTPAGGTIRVYWQAHEDGARFVVADTGIGISQKDLPRLTERFYRVDIGRSRASGGTGLGLSIVKHALESFDGHLEIESQAGVGSRFICNFPVHRVQRSGDGSTARIVNGS
jgi:two-component system phosphate regulon sensor histidine kinase PhoR